jgi:hypothetical protein
MGHFVMHLNTVAMMYVIPMPRWVQFVELGVVVLALFGGVILAVVLGRRGRR